MEGDLSERLVDALGLSYGVHPGFRAAHAKGVLCAATFTPDPAAAELSRAAHLAGPAVRAHVRFSNGSGDPHAHDGQRDGRGMAVKFYLPDKTTTDLVSITLPVFFARDPEDLIAFNEARRTDPATGQPDLAKIGAYLAEHPETVPAVQAAMSAGPAASYAQLTYHAIHAFRFVNAGGTSRYGRYHWIPDAGEAALDDADAMSRDAGYLATDLAERLATTPVGFRLDVELAVDGDPVDDPTAVWPDDRERETLGHLDVTALAFDRERDGDILVFDPSRVTDGIEMSDDAILRARSGAYRVSVTRRTTAFSG